MTIIHLYRNKYLVLHPTYRNKSSIVLENNIHNKHFKPELKQQDIPGKIELSIQGVEYIKDDV